jgi:hypothetical protein
MNSASPAATVLDEVATCGTLDLPLPADRRG